MTRSISIGWALVTTLAVSLAWVAGDPLAVVSILFGSAVGAGVLAEGLRA